MIKCKDTVRFSILRVQIWNIFERIYTIYKNHGYYCMITCGTEAHGPDDPHTQGFAIDLRNWHIASDDEREQIRAEMAQSLGPIYTVIWEREIKSTGGQIVKGSHYHIQIRKDLWRSMI